MELIVSVVLSVVSVTADPLCNLDNSVEVVLLLSDECCVAEGTRYHIALW